MTSICKNKRIGQTPDLFVPSLYLPSTVTFPLSRFQQILIEFAKF